MPRWIEVLDSVTQSYNGSYHRSIKMAPRVVTKTDEKRLWNLQYGPQNYATIRTRRFAFKKEDTIRISHVRQSFDLGIKEGIPYYTLNDTMGDSVHGTFYESELNRVAVSDQTVYRIEKVLRGRQNEALVRWMG